MRSSCILSILRCHRSVRSACSAGEGRHWLFNIRRIASGDILKNSASSTIVNCGLFKVRHCVESCEPACGEFLFPPSLPARFFVLDANLLGIFSEEHFYVQPILPMANRAMASAATVVAL
jgi:hypothetical protein